MSEGKGAPDVQRFDEKEYDVSCCCDRLCCGFALLTLGEEDAEFRKSCWCGMCKSKKRGPYGELGTVDSDQCLCFHSFKAASLLPGEDNGQCIGCGCDKESVDEVVEEMKKRQALRGDRAKTRMGEATIASLKSLHQKIDAVMAHLDMEPIKDSEQMQR